MIKSKKIHKFLDLVRQLNNLGNVIITGKSVVIVELETKFWKPEYKSGPFKHC